MPTPFTFGSLSNVNDDICVVLLLFLFLHGKVSLTNSIKREVISSYHRIPPPHNPHAKSIYIPTKSIIFIIAKTTVCKFFLAKNLRTSKQSFTKSNPKGSRLESMT
jgi:hypothetical protein